MNEPKKFNEFKIEEFHHDKGELVIDRKYPTKRGSVSISIADAEIMNRGMENTRILYELAEEIVDLKKMNKTQLTDYCDSKGYVIDQELTKKLIIEEIEKLEI